MKTVTLLIGASLVAGSAFAKLPDASPEAKAKAEVTKAENAHKDKVANFQLCKSQNAVAARHLASSGKAKKAPPAACEDPGKFVPPPVTVAAAPASPTGPAAASANPAPATTAAKK